MAMNLTFKINLEGKAFKGYVFHDSWSGFQFRFLRTPLSDHISTINVKECAVFKMLPLERRQEKLTMGDARILYKEFWALSHLMASITSCGKINLNQKRQMLY